MEQLGKKSGGTIVVMFFIIHKQFMRKKVGELNVLQLQIEELLPYFTRSATTPTAREHRLNIEFRRLLISPWSWCILPKYYTCKLSLE